MVASRDMADHASKPSARIRAAQPLSSGFLKLTRYEFDTDKHDGGTQTVVREVMERGHAVAVLGYDPQRDEVVLVNEFRPGCLIAGDPPFTDNLCAGGIADGESLFVRGLTTSWAPTTPVAIDGWNGPSC